KPSCTFRKSIEASRGMPQTAEVGCKSSSMTVGSSGNETALVLTQKSVFKCIRLPATTVVGPFSVYSLNLILLKQLIIYLLTSACSSISFAVHEACAAASSTLLSGSF